MADNLRKGDQVRWNSHGGEATGEVEKKITEDTEEAGILDPDQADFVENVFRLSNKRVRDCMVPREKMAALELGTPPDKVLDAVRTGAHTRMPVYEGDPNNIIGIVNTKDLFYLFSLHGVVVMSVEPESPAVEAGVERGDLILRVAEQPVTSLDDYAKTVRAIKRGEMIRMLVKREGKSLLVAFVKR